MVTQDFYREKLLWRKYAEMEMKAGFVNHARNVWDRAVTQLPRESLLWLEYARMEQLLEDVPKARRVFDRWLAWVSRCILDVREHL